MPLSSFKEIKLGIFVMFDTQFFEGVAIYIYIYIWGRL